MQLAARSYITTAAALANVDNLFLATGENSFNSLIGAEDFSPATITASLLTGSPAVDFDSGDIGGLEGIFDQNAALFADVAGLSQADITTALTELGTFNSTAFSTALSDLFDPTAFSAFSADLPAISADFTAILTSFF